MKIKPGDNIPDSKVFIMEEQPKEISLRQIIGKSRVILFGLPGAFTPTCTNKHLPSFIKSKDELRKNNVKKIFCISINDPFVMDAWGKSFNLIDQLTLLSDAKGDFTKSIGAGFDWRGWGLRSKRYTMLLDDGIVKKVVEEEGKCELTAAENFLKEL